MSKRIIALLLCAVMLIPCFAGCSSSKDEDDIGAYITMYLTDNIYDFDPANAYYNTDTLNVVSMLFDTLFTLNDKGKVKKSLVDKYTIKENVEENEYFMELTLNNVYWSNGFQLSADDVVYAWKRLLTPTNNYEAAALLYDIKNARAVKNGNISIDDIGIEAVAINIVKVTFEGPIDYDQFLLNLTSVATAPLLENYVQKNPDWAKKPSTMVTSGSFKVGKVFYANVLDEDGFNKTAYDDNAVNQEGQIQDKESQWEMKSLNYFYLERNIYYYRDTERDAIDESVTPYRILVDCSKSDKDILKDYQNGKIFYIGDIPLSLRKDAYVQKNAEISNALSTTVCYLNETADFNGTKLFADANVRKALSLAIDREKIAKEIVYAQAATGFVCPGVFNEGKISKKTDFRTAGGDLIAAFDNTSIGKAKDLLTEAGIDASEYEFSIKVPDYDEENVKIAEMIADCWNALGFVVSVEQITTVQNNDYLKEVDTVPTDVCDDLFVEAIQRGKYEVILFDYNAFSVDAYSMLAQFAGDFSGMELVSTQDAETGKLTYSLSGHTTGYNSEDYNMLMEAVYYIPYFASLTEDSTNFVDNYQSTDTFKAVYNKVKEIYAANGITPTTDSKKWTAQKAILLHKAEELLMADMPVIPVLFKQNAVLVGDDLSNVTSNYYIPAYFRKTKLKDYKDYTYTEEDGDIVSIFSKFPEIDWSKASK